MASTTLQANARCCAGLDPEMTVAAFQELLASRLGVPIAYQELLAGFPPKSVQAR